MPAGATVSTVALKKKREAARAAAEAAGSELPAGSSSATLFKEPKKENDVSTGVHCLDALIDFLNSQSVQAVCYLMFVIIMQSLLSAMRNPFEYLLDKHIMDRVVENHFDASHNTFADIRRPADVYEWGNTVLWPGLFGDAGPCSSDVGSLSPKSCMDDVWPDGDDRWREGHAHHSTRPKLQAACCCRLLPAAHRFLPLPVSLAPLRALTRSRGHAHALTRPRARSSRILARHTHVLTLPHTHTLLTRSFHLGGATAFNVPELVELMDKLDWTDGISFRQGAWACCRSCCLPLLPAAAACRCCLPLLLASSFATSRSHGPMHAGRLRSTSQAKPLRAHRPAGRLLPRNQQSVRRWGPHLVRIRPR